MKHRLSVLLKNSKKSKYKEGFIKYLNSLNYEEFKELYVHYLKIGVRYENIYKKNKPKFLSKKWFINLKIKNNNIKLYLLFKKSNSNYIKRIFDDMDKITSKRLKLLNNINELNNKINNLSKETIVLKENFTKKDIMNFTIIIVQNVCFKNEIERLKNELEKLGDDIV